LDRQNGAGLHITSHPKREQRRKAKQSKEKTIIDKKMGDIMRFLSFTSALPFVFDQI
jgi:hypothetical protein